MTPDEALRALRRLRYSPRKGRRLGLTWVARMAGYTLRALHRTIARGWITPLMASRLAPVFRLTKTLPNGHIAFFGALDDGRDPRGDWSRTKRKRRRRKVIRRSPAVTERSARSSC